MTGADGVVVIVVVGAFGLVLLSMAIEALTARGQVAGRISGFMGRQRFRGVQKWIEGRRHHVTPADEQITRLPDNRKAGAKASALTFLPSPPDSPEL